MTSSRILQRENLDTSDDVSPVQFLFAQLEMHCFSPYFPCTRGATGLEAAVCIGEYLNLNKTLNVKLKELSFLPDAV